jgi:hypothetical protein
MTPRPARAGAEAAIAMRARRPGMARDQTSAAASGVPSAEGRSSPSNRAHVGATSSIETVSSLGGGRRGEGEGGSDKERSVNVGFYPAFYEAATPGQAQTVDRTSAPELSRGSGRGRRKPRYHVAVFPAPESANRRQRDSGDLESARGCRSPDSSVPPCSISGSGLPDSNARQLVVREGIRSRPAAACPTPVAHL